MQSKNLYNTVLYFVNAHKIVVNCVFLLIVQSNLLLTFYKVEVLPCQTGKQ